MGNVTRSVATSTLTAPSSIPFAAAAPAERSSEGMEGSGEVEGSRATYQDRPSGSYSLNDRVGVSLL